MQVTETSSQGLKREFKVVLPAADLASRLEGQLVEMRGKVRINGFRPGKVPMAHLRRLYGRSVMSDVVQNAVTEANKKIVADHQLRLAQEPQINLPEDRAEVERALAAEGDLNFTINVEVLPKFEVQSFDQIALERPVAPVTDVEIAEALDRLADRHRAFEPRPEGEGAAKGDRVTIDFVGTINGEAFEGGTGEKLDVILGSNTFIPGFEDQLIDVKAGEKREVVTTFPDNYMAAALAGKAASFAVTASVVAAPAALAMDDEFAKTFGLDSLEAMKTSIRDSMTADYAKASREKVKRALLDTLDKSYAFELPQGLVEQEFAGIWRQVEAEQKQSGRSFADEGATEDSARADYRRIAERRVRLGLLLAEVGETAKVQVTEAEVTNAVVERARQMPGQEKLVWDYYQKNPEALAELRAPIFEEKVVDHIIALAKVTDVAVTKEELFKAAEDDAPAALVDAPAAVAPVAQPE